MGLIFSFIPGFLTLLNKLQEKSKNQLFNTPTRLNFLPETVLGVDDRSKVPGSYVYIQGKKNIIVKPMLRVESKLLFLYSMYCKKNIVLFVFDRRLFFIIF